MELAERDLVSIPVLVQDIGPEKLKMGNDRVHGTVREMARSLEPFQEPPDNLPGDIVRGEIPILKIGKIRSDISQITADGIRGKVLCLKHFNKKR